MPRTAKVFMTNRSQAVRLPKGDSWYLALFPPRVPAGPGLPDDQAKLLRLRARRR